MILMAMLSEEAMEKGDTVSYIKSDKGVTVELSSPDNGDQRVKDMLVEIC